MSAPPSLEAEAAIYSLKRTVAAYRDSVEAMGRTDSRLAPGGRTYEAERAQDAVMRLVTTSEMYVVEVLLVETEARLVGSPTAVVLWDDVESRYTQTWERRRSGWKKFHGLDLKASGAWDPLEGFVDARNAIAHGLGRLTRVQLKNRGAVESRLLKAGIALNGEEVVVGGEDVARCEAVIEDFILWLDGERMTLPRP